ncbi:DUF874 family protein [Plesiomonas shigelloides]|uniref:DUF874 family protein n=1 Tax=Plesiomonas shigelloides TaxID=703 RepID=UPI003CC8170B
MRTTPTSPQPEFVSSSPAHLNTHPAGLPILIETTEIEKVQRKKFTGQANKAAQDRRQKTEGRRQKTENRRQKTENRRQKAEDRRQKTEDRRQKTEDRRQKTEDRRQKTETVSFAHSQRSPLSLPTSNQGR